MGPQEEASGVGGGADTTPFTPDDGLVPIETGGKEVYHAPHSQAPASMASPQSDLAKPYHEHAYRMQQDYNQHHNLGSPYSDKTSEQKKILGLRKTTFILVVVAVLLLAGTISAAAVAGTMAARANSSQSTLGVSSNKPSSNATTNSTPPSPSPVGTALPILSLSVPSDLGGTTAECPKANGQLFTVPGTNITFKKECGRNYPNANLGMVPMSNMEDCIRLCATFYQYPQSGNGRCLMVNWGWGEPQGDSLNYCWLKYEKGTGEVANDFETAYVVDSTGTFVGNSANIP